MELRTIKITRNGKIDVTKCFMPRTTLECPACMRQTKQAYENCDWKAHVKTSFENAGVNFNCRQKVKMWNGFDSLR
jgi:hypothetical protein